MIFEYHEVPVFSWSCFGMQGVTRTLLGLPDEDEDECKDSSKDSQNNNNIDKEKDSASDASGQVEREPDQNEQLQEQQQQHQAGSQDQQSTAPRTTLGAFMTETRSRSPEMEVSTSYSDPHRQRAWP